MSRRLGETLVRIGALSEEQLQRAVTDQIVFGGSLPTSILELGLLDEDRLGEALARAYDVDYVDRERLSSVPYELIRTFPPRLAEKHRVVPCSIEGKAIRLAMMDPSNLLALDEVAFVTGYRIIPSVALEVRILEALEKYFGMVRSQRFLMLAEDLTRRTAAGNPGPAPADPIPGPPGIDDAATMPAGQAHPSPPAVGQTETDAQIDDTASSPAGQDQPSPPAVGQIDAGAQGAGVAADPDRLVATAAVSGLAGEEPTVTAVRPEHGITGTSVDPERPLHEGRLHDGGLEEDVTHPTRPQDREGPPGDSLTFLPGAARRLAEARRVEDVFATLITYAAARLPRCMVFVPKAQNAVLWSSSCRDLQDGDLAGLRVSLEESVFALADDRDDHYLGAPPRRRGVMAFYDALGVPLPKTVVVVPIRVQDRIAAYLYCDGAGQEILALDLPSLRSLCARAGFALQILILRNKILAD